MRNLNRMPPKKPKKATASAAEEADGTGEFVVPDPLQLNENAINHRPGSAAVRIKGSENWIYPYRADIDLNEAILIATGGKGFQDPAPDHPVCVILLGTPGSGKSFALNYVKDAIGLDPEKAVYVSLDALVESVWPFRFKTAAIGSEKSLSFKNKVSKASGVYSGMWRAKKNNRPAHEGESLPFSLNDLRYELMRKAIEAGQNIIYERTISDPKKDILGPDVFDPLAASSKPYKIFLIYPKNVTVEEVVANLERRPDQQMARNPPFFRAVPPDPYLVEKSLRDHMEYYHRFLVPRLERGELIEVELPSSDSASASSSAAATSRGGRPRNTRKSRASRRRLMTRRR